MLRKLLFVCGLLLLSLVSRADRVSAERAGAVAGRFLDGNTKAAGKVLTLKLADPAYYIFNAEGGGFVIVAGDDAVTPILAYSDEYTFETEGMPANLADWMTGLRNCILAAQAQGLQPTPEIARAWARLGDAAAAPARDGESARIETALWGQGDPYNRLCPEVDGGRSVTGCVATAISIVMRHYQYPDVGHGSLPDYSYYTDKGHHRSQEGHTLGETYQWDKMPLKYVTGKFTDEEADAVARLMYDVGIMMEMQYNPTGSGAYTHVAGDMLVKHMGFDASVHMLEKGYYSTEDWLAMVKAEIDAGRPVLYSGYSDAGGHAFVADGYSTNGYIHFNWGWNGSSNGYFAITDVGGFTDGNLALFNLFPDEGNKASNGVPGYTDISTKATITRNASFNVTVYDLVGSGNTFAGQVAIGKYDNAGILQELVSNPVNFLHLGVLEYQDRRFSCTITTPIYPGDCLRPCYREDKNSDWHPARFNAEYKGDESISLGSGDLLSENASLRFDTYTRLLTLTSAYEAATCTFASEDGTDRSDLIQSAPADPGITFTIPTANLHPGNYILTLTFGTLSASFTLTL